MSDFLTLHTEESAHAFPCPPQAVLVLGSSEGCDLAFDGDAIAPQHVELRHLDQKRFQLRALSTAHRLNVNGVTAPVLEVETPFRLRLGDDVIDFSLGSEPVKTSSNPVGSRRRDYLLGSARLRQRAAPAPSGEPDSRPRSAQPVAPPPFPNPPPPPVNHVRILQPVSGPTKAAPVIAPKSSAGGWGLSVIIGLPALAAIYLGYPFLFPEPKATSTTPPQPAAIEAQAARPVIKAMPPLAPAPPTDTSREDVVTTAKAFFESWNEKDASGVLRFISPSPAEYFAIPDPRADAVLQLEEEFREHWPLRIIRADGAPMVNRMGESLFEITQRHLFDLRGLNGRHATGTGMLLLRLERVTAKTWLITRAAEKIDLRTMEPSRDAFHTASTLRDLKPALNEGELKLKAQDDLAMRMKTGDAKGTLIAILENAARHPHETYWRFATDQTCDALSRALFAEGQWADPSCLAEVRKLSDMGIPSALLLHGHLLRAGYLLPRSVAGGEALYRQAYEKAKSREARFYYAEALYIGAEHERASAIALATMKVSKHPLEAYLAAHLLWKKAELDPSLWQQVYEIAARAATRHAPAKNLAGLVLLKHGQTTKERQAGFLLIEQAAKEGVTEAMKNLSACHALGDGCPRNPAEAEAWKRKAETSPPPPKRHFSEFEAF